MPSKYLFIKCVGPDARMSEQALRVLRLSELQQLVAADSDLRWGFDPRGAIPIRNSDGSVATMQPFPGFSFVAPPDLALFFICYEYNDGLAIHPEDDKRVHGKAVHFAEKLGAKLFEI